MYYVYIMECQDGQLYTGITDDVERRFKEHQHKVYPEVYPERSRRAYHFTSYNPAVKILHTEAFPDKHQAAKRERQIKGWTRAKKLALAQGDLKLLKEL